MQFNVFSDTRPNFSLSQNAPFDIEESENVHQFDCVRLLRQSFCISIGGSIRLCLQYESECGDRNRHRHRLVRMVWMAAQTHAICLEDFTFPDSRRHIIIIGNNRFPAAVLGVRRTLAMAFINHFTNSITI